MFAVCILCLLYVCIVFCTLANGTMPVYTVSVSIDINMLSFFLRRSSPHNAFSQLISCYGCPPGSLSTYLNLREGHWKKFKIHILKVLLWVNPFKQFLHAKVPKVVGPIPSTSSKYDLQWDLSPALACNIVFSKT